MDNIALLSFYLQTFKSAPVSIDMKVEGATLALGTLGLSKKNENFFLTLFNSTPDVGLSLFVIAVEEIVRQRCNDNDKIVSAVIKETAARLKKRGH